MLDMFIIIIRRLTMATYIDENLNFTHTKGDHLNKILTIKSDGIPINWTTEGYISGTMQVRDKPNSSGTLVATILIDITVNGQITFMTTQPIDITPGTYYYDIQMTMAGGKIKTLWDTKYRKFIITQDITV